MTTISGIHGDRSSWLSYDSLSVSVVFGLQIVCMVLETELLIVMTEETASEKNKYAILKTKKMSMLSGQPSKHSQAALVSQYQDY